MRVLAELMRMMGRSSIEREATFLPAWDQCAHLIAVNSPRLLFMALTMEAHFDMKVGARGSLDCSNSVSYQVNWFGHSMLRSDCCRGKLLYVMALLSPAPVNCWCNSVAGKASKRTITGKHSRSTCCLELDDSLHISLSSSCMSATVVLSIPPLLHPVNSPALQSSSSNSAASMPRLRQRMRSDGGPLAVPGGIRTSLPARLPKSLLPQRSTLR